MDHLKLQKLSNIDFSEDSQSSRKRPPQKFDKVFVTRAGCLQEYALISNRIKGGHLGELQKLIIKNS